MCLVTPWVRWLCLYTHVSTNCHEKDKSMIKSDSVSSFIFHSDFVYITSCDGYLAGAMIACKLAAMSPERICSLALLSVTGGGYECFPKVHL